MMRDSAYSTLVVPVAASYPTGENGCCGGGAEGARAPQQRLSDGRPGELQADGAPGAPAKGGRGSCRCWWVAIAAVVLIAVVAK